WRNSLDHYQEFVIIVALDLKIEVMGLITLKAPPSVESCLTGILSTESNQTKKMAHRIFQMLSSFISFMAQLTGKSPQMPSFANREKISKVLIQ
ncbi:hypothetical protein Lpp125_14775, partial [Lacticaseibacillus paracasei subsp. paracasei Lpp125]